MTNQSTTRREADYSTQRLSQRYRFDDPNMDLFFLGALGWGPAGGLSVGEAFHIANQIVDGDSESWAQAFEKQGSILSEHADIWQERGWIRAAGEERLKAFACYRMAWQFVSPGEYFLSLFRASQTLFDQAVRDLGFAVESFTVPYKGGELPGHFFNASDPAAPTVLVIGGADTCHEDRFLSQGRHLVERGYSVALVDLPGQGIVQEQGLHWETNVESSIGAVIDALIDRFGVDTSKLAMLGMSLGGYFGCRAAAEEPRLAAIIATPPLPRPGELWAQVGKEEANKDAPPPSAAARRNHEVLMWKAGVSSVKEIIEIWADSGADPSKVTVPFLSVVGTQEGPIWQIQAKQWHESIRSQHKSLVLLGPDTGADAHCQGNNPLRLTQEADGWLREIFGTS